jgi:hypothetical protein
MTYIPLQLQTINRRQKVPFSSNRQRRFMNANKAKMEKQGVDVNEWNDASKGMKLPERAGKRITKKKPTK